MTTRVDTTTDATTDATTDDDTGTATGSPHVRRPWAMQWQADNCSVARTLGVIGEKWTLQVLREVFLGIRRFEDMHTHAGIPRQVLSRRLTSLVTDGILVRVPYREEGARERHEYRLSERGLELRTPLMALMAWGDRHLGDPDGPAIQVVHRGCGEPVHLEPRCEAGHAATGPRELRFSPGPGALPAHLRESS